MCDLRRRMGTRECNGAKLSALGNKRCNEKPETVCWKQWELNWCQREMDNQEVLEMEASGRENLAGVSGDCANCHICSSVQILV